ncbi:hypothetical protein CQ042_13850 [Microbacterium sp. MYb62]|nr:hypothetical protein CQ042_13850 [Microbacterium sp. MYb62]
MAAVMLFALSMVISTWPEKVEWYSVFTVVVVSLALVLALVRGFGEWRKEKERAKVPEQD